MDCHNDIHDVLTCRQDCISKNGICFLHAASGVMDFGLLVKNQLYTGEKLDAELNTNFK